MKHILTIISCFSVLSMSAQVPDYVPQDGLVAWYPFNGNADDESGNGNNGVVIAAELTGDRAGNSNSAYFFNGLNSFIDISTVNSNQLPLSISVWFRTDAVGEMSIIDSDSHGHFGHSIILAYDPTGTNPLVDNQNIFIQYHNGAIDTDYMNPVDEWTHLALNLNLNYAEVFINGSLHGEYFPSMASTLDGSGFRVGKHNDYDPQWFHGSIDDIAIYERTLSASEILILAQPTLGCTNESACNFDPEANSDDNSCEYVSCHCLDGTIWSDELGGCIPATTCPQDLDYDGVVGVNDLMNLLSAFGTPCEPPAAASTCGEPVTYHGYDYETVLIGEQCWFAENLRTELYQNGDSIPGDLSDEEWASTNSGAHAIYENDPSNLEVYGRLYNWHATSDQGGLCPNGWHVPSLQECELLVLHTGGQSTAALMMKSTESESPPWNGLNSSGFSAVPGGQRMEAWGYFNLGNAGEHWTSSSSGLEMGYDMRLWTDLDAVQFTSRDKDVGNSVRCLKD